MIASGQDFELYTGDDKRPEITVKDDEGNAVNLDGASIEWGAFDPADGSTVGSLSKTTSDGGININDAPNGKFIVKIDASDTDSVSSDIDAEHEAKVTLASGLSDHVTTGTVSIIVSNV